MKTDIASRVLPKEIAIQYFAQTLSAAQGTDCDGVIERLNQGTFRALVPLGIDEQQALEFKNGGILTFGPKVPTGSVRVQTVCNTAAAAGELVLEEFANCSKPILWIHEPLLTEDEVSERKLPYKIVGNALYLVYEQRPGADFLITDLIRYSVLSWHFLAFVTDGEQQFQTTDEITLCTKFILVGAYDGESFLYWN